MQYSSARTATNKKTAEPYVDALHVQCEAVTPARRTPCPRLVLLSYTDRNNVVLVDAPLLAVEELDCYGNSTPAYTHHVLEGVCCSKLVTRHQLSRVICCTLLTVVCKLLELVGPNTC